MHPWEITALQVPVDLQEQIKKVQQKSCKVVFLLKQENKASCTHLMSPYRESDLILFVSTTLHQLKTSDNRCKRTAAKTASNKPPVCPVPYKTCNSTKTKCLATSCPLHQCFFSTGKPFPISSLSFWSFQKERLRGFFSELTAV